MNRKFLTIVSLIFTAGLALPAYGTEKRCGWLYNPTPANWWLTDRDGTWIISTQGGRQAQGLELVKFFGGELERKNFVATNGNYGYYCACMNVSTTSRNGEKRITRIFSGEQVTLKQCRQDPALPREER
jgi:hypothetical protein